MTASEGWRTFCAGGGAELPRLTQIKHPAAPSWLPLLKSAPRMLVPFQRVKWGRLEGEPGPCSRTTPPPAVAWHVFSEGATTQIRRACRKASFTVNSFLLKHLSKAVRPYLADQSSFVPWMIPVNLRGKVSRERDTQNHSSYVSVKVQSYSTVRNIHSDIYSALSRGEHWANWYSYRASSGLTDGLRKQLLKMERCTSQWNLGGFSNLGDWDAEKKITLSDCAGPWLFSPPVLRFQRLGAGCVTFQNRLSLTLQLHPELTTSTETPKAWVQSWVKEIEMDLASMLPEPVILPSWTAAC